MCQNAASSYSVTVTVLTPNIISISQAGIQVTITGSNFGATQNNGQVWLGTANGLLQTWSGAQIVAQVAAGSSSGTVQVLQSGVWSNALPFATGTLQIASVSPMSGAPGTQVTIAGTGFGSSVSNGMVWLGSVAGNVISWSDTQVLAGVASGAVSGVARIQQNGVWSNAVGFTVPGGGNTLTPAMLNMTVGDTQTLRAVNASGQAVTGLAWSSSNPAVVSLSAADPPVLTALTAGRVTITAGAGSADVTVSAGAPPVGTTLWTNPTPWATVTGIVPAVPSETGVADVFAVNYDDGIASNLGIAAITSDGATAWTASLSNSCPNCTWPSRPAVADFQGGMLAVVWGSDTRNFLNIVKLDGLTGQARTIYGSDVGDVSLDAPVPHPDGTVFAHLVQVYHDESWPAWGDWVVGIDSATGGQKFSIPIGLQGPGGGRGANFGSLIIAGDGYAYATYLAHEYLNQVYVAHLMVLRVGTDGTYTNVELKSWTNQHGTRNWTGGLISNGDQGVVVTWDVVQTGSNPSDYAQDTHYLGMGLVSGSGATVVNGNGPLVAGQRLDFGPATANPVVPVLQAQDGSFVGKVLSNGWDMVSFDAGGAVRWVVPNDEPAIATEDGGVIGKSGAIYDQHGAATGQMARMAVQSWLGYAYQLGSIDGVWADLVWPATGFWAFFQANMSGNNAATDASYYQLQSCNDANLHPRPSRPGTKDAVFTAWYWLKQRIGDSTRAASLDTNVFHDPSGEVRRAFMRFLMQGKGPEFYDGERSKVKLTDAGCGGPSGRTVQRQFQLSNDTTTCELAAVTCRQDPTKPLRTFFEPRAISLDNGGNTDANVALEFHEAMHSFKQIGDPGLQTFLGCTANFPDTRDITIYLQQFVGSEAPPLTPLTSTYIKNHRMPSSTNLCVR